MFIQSLFYNKVELIVIRRVVFIVRATLQPILATKNPTGYRPTPRFHCVVLEVYDFFLRDTWRSEERSKGFPRLGVSKFFCLIVRYMHIEHENEFSSSREYSF